MPLALAMATAFGAGKSRVAPGTVGTLVAVPPAAALTALFPEAAFVQVLLILVVCAAAVWSADLAAGHLGQKDPGQIVIDEVAGYFVTIALLPPGWVTLGAGFLLFRLFDVWKPPPCGRAEALPGGIGVVADDLVAGLYANLALRSLAALGLLSL